MTDHRRQAAEELAEPLVTLSPEELFQSPYVLIGTVANWWRI